jgi:hypothetical protein
MTVVGDARLGAEDLRGLKDGNEANTADIGGEHERTVGKEPAFNPICGDDRSSESIARRQRISRADRLI